MSLNHMKYVNTAKFAEQTVTRCPLGSILVSSEYSQVVIPLFQRPYCWSEQQLGGWIDNVREGAKILGESGNILEQLADIDETNSDEFHSVGIGRFKTSGDKLLCVDGQQRLTTTSLLVSAVIKVLREMEGEGCGSLIEVAEQCLYNNTKQVHKLLHVRESFQPSSLQPFVRLLPSEVDRVPYFCAVTGITLPTSSGYKEDSFVLQTKQFFLNYLENLLSSTPESEKVSLLAGILKSSLLWMRMMKVEVKSSIHLGQWFLWLQEKSLFGFAALLCNNTPGVKFRAGDLVKNLLMSAFIEHPMQIQETLYEDKWIQPIQNHVNDLDDFLKTFLNEEKFKEVENENSSERYMSKYEKQILALINAAGTDDDSDEDEAAKDEDVIGDKFSGIRLYSRFQSYYESFLQGTDLTPQDLETVHMLILDKLKTFLALHVN